MEGVAEVRRDGPKSSFLEANIGGKDKDWEAEIIQQIPDKRIVWQSVEGAPNRGQVTFESLDPDRTRITLTIEYEPEGFLERVGDVLAIPSSQIEGDLKRFRDFIESEVETNGGRGEIGERARPDNVTPSIRGASFEDANARPIAAEGQEATNESTFISEIADENDSMPAKKRVSLESAPPAIEPALIGAERAPEASQFYRESAGIVIPTHEQIAVRAYELYLARGQEPGHEAEDWLEAEKQLSVRTSAPATERRSNQSGA
jgi:hypothetical protein